MITLKTSNAQVLIEKICDAMNVSKGKAGSIPNWDCIVDPNGTIFFTYNLEQHNNKAYFQVIIPVNTKGEIIFSIVKLKTILIKPATYSVYHGKFIEMLFQHFPTGFISVAGTSLPDTGHDIT